MANTSVKQSLRQTFSLPENDDPDRLWALTITKRHGPMFAERFAFQSKHLDREAEATEAHIQVC